MQLDQILHRRTVEFTNDNPNGPNAAWYLFASLYKTDMEAFEAVKRCKAERPDAAVRLKIETIFL